MLPSLFPSTTLCPYMVFLNPPSPTQNKGIAKQPVGAGEKLPSYPQDSPLADLCHSPRLNPLTLNSSLFSAGLPPRAGPSPALSPGNHQSLSDPPLIRLPQKKLVGCVRLCPVEV